MNTSSASPKVTLRQIGTVALKKGIVLTKTFDYPIWYSNLSCGPQTAALFTSDEETPEGHIQHITAQFHGTVVEAYPRKKIGSVDSVSIAFPLHEIEEALAISLGALPPHVVPGKISDDYEFTLDKSSVALISTFVFGAPTPANGQKPFSLVLLFKKAVQRFLLSHRINPEETLRMVNGVPC